MAGDRDRISPQDVPTDACAMHLLLLSRYGRLGASSRQRFYQFLPDLAEAGIRVTTSALLDDDYVRDLYAGRRPDPVALAAAYLGRLKALAGARRYDGIWVEKEALPWLPFLAERLALPAGRPVIADYDDAWFHRYDRHANPWVRRLLGRKIDRVMAHASLVVAGNPYLATHAEAAGAKRVAILPTVVDPLPFAPHRPPETFTIGWIGTPGTSRYLEALRAPLARLAETGPLRIALVGAAPGTLAGLPVEIRPWRAETEATELARCSVGIMPLPDDPWERGKCGYKLIQYMAAGLAVVASPVGVNTDIVDAGRTGFLAADDDGWFGSLSCLRDEPALAEALGTAGRARMMARYSLPAALPRLVALLRSAAGRPPAGITGA